MVEDIFQNTDSALSDSEWAPTYKYRSIVCWLALRPGFDYYRLYGDKRESLYQAWGAPARRQEDCMTWIRVFESHRFCVVANPKQIIVLVETNNFCLNATKAFYIKLIKTLASADNGQSCT